MPTVATNCPLSAYLAPVDFRPPCTETASARGLVTAGWWGASAQFTWPAPLPKGGVTQWRFAWLLDGFLAGNTAWQTLIEGLNPLTYDMCTEVFGQGALWVEIQLPSGRVYRTAEAIIGGEA